MGTNWMTCMGTRSVILADRHHGLTEGVYHLLRALFETVLMVADEESLLSSVAKLRPQMVIADLSLVRAGSLSWLRNIRQVCPRIKIIALSIHDEPSVLDAAMQAGADRVVLKRAISTELVPAIEELLPEPPSEKAKP
jgi:DNA-binding NarL/FixJ family response regulator